MTKTILIIAGFPAAAQRKLINKKATYIAKGQCPCKKNLGRVFDTYSPNVVDSSFIFDKKVTRS